MLAPSIAQAATFFDTDFETCAVGTTNDFPCEGWDDRADIGASPEWGTGPERNTLEITSATSFSGAKSVKEFFNSPGGGVNHPSIYKTIPARDHQFFRFALKRDASFVTCPFNNSTKMFRLRAEGRPDGAGYPVIMVIQQSLRYRLGIEGGYAMGSVTSNLGPTVSTSWEQVELEVKMNTPGVADGLLRLWVDDTLYIEWLDLELRGPLPTSMSVINTFTPSTYQFNMAQIYAQCGDGGSMYWDRVAAGDTRIGLVGATDTVPPTTPTGLAIQ